MRAVLRHPRLASFALFVALAVIHTWPLASAPAQLSRNDNADTVLNEWIVAWVAHQAATDPARLWDANIFYPEKNTLAYSEPLLVPAALGAPLLWAGQSPVLVYNLLVLAGLTLTAWAGCLVVHRWTGDLAAGIVSGTLIAFNAHTLTRLPQLQAFHVEFLPLALLALDCVLVSARWKYSVLLALCVALQGATSYYTLVLTAIAVTVGWLVRPEDWWGKRARQTLPPLAVAAALAILALLPVLLPYRALGQVRPLDEVARYSASWRDYLASPARMHYDTWSAGWFGGETALFPGVTSLALAAVAIGAGIAWRDRRARMALAFGFAGVALSFGPAMPGYAALYHWVAPLQGIRNAARFGYLGMVALALLAGFGLAALRARWRHARWLQAATIAAVALANLDALAAPIGLEPPERIASLHATLRDTSAVVVHIPFYPPDRLPHNASYLLQSTANWRPILNGYSGMVPASYVEHARALAGFPDATAIAALRAAGVTHILVHDRALRDWTDHETAEAVQRSPDLRQIAREGDVALYVLR